MSTSNATGSNGLVPMRPTCSTRSSRVTALVRAGSTTKPSAHALAMPVGSGSTVVSVTANGRPSRAVTATRTGRRRRFSPEAARAASSIARFERITRTGHPFGMGRAVLQQITSPVAASASARVVRNCDGSSCGRTSRRSPAPTGASRRTSTSAIVTVRKRSRPPLPPPRRTFVLPRSRVATTVPTSSPRLFERS